MNTAVLISCVLQVTLFAVAAGALYLIARRLHASLGSITASVSLALVLLLTALAASPWPRWEFSPTGAAKAPMPASIETGEATIQDATTIAPTSDAPTTDDSMLSPALAAWSAFTEALADPPQQITLSETPTTSFQWRTALRWLLIACLVVGIARFVWGVWVVRRLVAESCALGKEDTKAIGLLANLQTSLDNSRQVQLRQSPTIATPATVGWRRPTILLPTPWRDWSDNELKAVLAHELAHIAARDYRSWLVARLAVAVHFYHPLVHWLAGRLQMEQELAADAMAVRLVGDRQSYLHSLASLALATPNHRLSGPARTLIPGRSLLMRRVEMLREAKQRTSSKSTSPLARTLTAICLAVVAVAVAGVRQVASGQDAPGAVAEEPSTTTTSPADVPRIGLEVVPDDTVFAISVRPAELLSQPAYEDLTKKLDQIAPEDLRDQLSFSQIAEFLYAMYGATPEQSRFVIRFVEPAKCDTFVELLVEKMKKSEGYSAPSATEWNTEDQRLTKVDATTVVLDQYGRAESPRPLPPAVKTGLPWAAAWQQSSDKQLTLAFNVRRYWTQLEPDKQTQMIGVFPMQMFGPLITDTEWAVASLDAIKGLKIDASVQCTGEESATSVAATGKAALTLFSNMVEQQRAVAKGEVAGMGLPQHNLASVDALFDLVLEFTNNAQIEPAGDQVKLTFDSQKTDAAKLAITTGLLMPAVEASREAARRTQSMNNMKQLMLAMHNYESTYNHLPPAVVYETLPDGKRVPRSWRVEILPYLEPDGAELFQQYKKDEPWDSPANSKVLAKIPAILRSPSDDTASTNTSYFAITGPETMFYNEKGTSFAEVTDGLSNTIAIVDAKRSIPWTKPEDIAYRSDEPLPQFGGWHPMIFLAGFGDGSVQVVSQNIDQQMLQRMFERADGNPIIR